ncbi:MAG: protein-glutamate O-methyltransferase CheR [Granulosicoccus sp.]
MAFTSKPELNEKCFKTLIEMIHSLTGITIKPERKAMLEGRLTRRLRALDLPDFESYVNYMKNNKSEEEEFINKITTNETYFYRTPRIWEFISDTYLSDWHAQNPSSTLNVWSAASSTGEEAHTLGVLLQAYKDKNPGFDYRITGTDIDSSVVQSATVGLYNGRSIDRFRKEKPDLFSSYMVGTDAHGYKVAPNIKRNIQFKILNLFNPAPVDKKYSLILLRNVLIYFSGEDIELVMQSVEKRLSASGIVIIGESESLNNLSTNFVTVCPTIYQRVDEIQGAKAA